MGLTAGKSDIFQVLFDHVHFWVFVAVRILRDCRGRVERWFLDWLVNINLFDSKECLSKLLR